MTPRFNLNWRYHRAVLVMALLISLLATNLLFTGLLPTPLFNRTENPIPDTEFIFAPPQQLYELSVRASEEGWTDALHYRAGEIQEGVGNFTAAAEHWEAIEAPDDWVLRRLALLYLRLERWQEMVAALDALLAVDPESGWANLQSALLLAPVHPSLAAQHLTKADDYDPQFIADLNHVLISEAHNPLVSEAAGAVMLEHEYWTYAEHAFWYATLIDSPNPDAMAYLAFAREQQGKSGEIWINAALETGHDMVQVQYIHGLYLRDQLDYVGSRDAFARAVQLDGRNPALYAELGTAYRLMGDLERAEYWLRYANDVSGNAPEFQAMLAVFYAEEGTNFTPASLAALQNASEALPPDPELLAGFGWAIYTMGDIEAGKQQIEAALALIPDHPAGLYYQARVLMEEGRSDEAISMMQNVAVSNSSYARLADELLTTWQADQQPQPTKEAVP